MKERPILFKGEMVRAILAGTKTQTRRVVKPQPDEDGLSHLMGAPHWDDTSERKYQCPYGQPGDRLWVRETWAPNNVQPIEHRPPVEFLYAATDSKRYAVCRWRPSIHMPRAASRIKLEVTEVRVERLQDISRGDAMAEGCPFPNMADGENPRLWYADLWNSINGNTPGSWDANPWVWCVSFRRVEQ